ncbi:MAG: hypothetical protein JWR37_427 [Mycobacterium sp.]|jgi:hypothetical protein|nr:hypothetical protein [Mycobacterium sp.]
MKRVGWRRLSVVRPSTFFVTILAIAAAVGIGFVTIGVPAPAASVPASAAARDALPSVGTGHQPSALFIGDSYTMGPNALSDLGYACLAATNMGWECNLANQPATGYISGGEGQRLPRLPGALDENSTSYLERFPRLRPLYHADVVVLDGGRNDIRFGIYYLRNMFEATIRRAIEAWPNSHIVVIAPWFIQSPTIEVPDVPGLTFAGYLRQSLRSFPEFDGVTYIDPGALGWFKDMDIRPYVADDGIHPNLEGHRKIGELLTAALIQDGLANVK